MNSKAMTSVVLVVLGAVGWTGRAASAGDGLIAHEGVRTERVEVDGQDYAYAVYRPAGLDREERTRGLVFLHGSGECGTDGGKMLTVGLPAAIAQHPDRWPFVVIIPQKPTRSSEWEEHGEAVMAILDRVIAEENVDTGRVALTGLSQGGHGTIALAAAHPGRFRAAAAVCGYIEPRWSGGKRVAGGLPGSERAAELIEAFRVTPLRLYHGKKDDVVPPAESEWLAGALRAAGVPCGLTLYPDANHNAWDEAYGDKELARWLVEMTD